MVYSLIERYWKEIKEELDIDEMKEREMMEICCICNEPVANHVTMADDLGGRVHIECVEMRGRDG